MSKKAEGPIQSQDDNPLGIEEPNLDPATLTKARKAPPRRGARIRAGKAVPHEPLPGLTPVSPEAPKRKVSPRYIWEVRSFYDGYEYLFEDILATDEVDAIRIAILENDQLRVSNPTKIRHRARKTDDTPRDPQGEPLVSEAADGDNA